MAKTFDFKCFCFCIYHKLRIRIINKMVLEPNVSPHKQIIKDDDVKDVEWVRGLFSFPLVLEKM